MQDSHKYKRLAPATDSDAVAKAWIPVRSARRGVDAASLWGQNQLAPPASGGTGVPASSGAGGM
jgi:hypothetical protein